MLLKLISGTAEREADSDLKMLIEPDSYQLVESGKPEPQKTLESHEH